MTGEEMEKAIGFILNSQASFETRLQKTSEQIERTGKQIEQTSKQTQETDRKLGMLLDSQNEFMATVLKQIEAQGEVNNTLRKGIREIADSQHEVAGAQAETNKRLAALTTAIERYMEGLNGKTLG